MLKSYYVFMFVVLYAIWFTGHEVTCGNYDLEFWEPQRRVYNNTRTTNADKNEDFSNDSLDDGDDSLDDGDDSLDDDDDDFDFDTTMELSDDENLSSDSQRSPHLRADSSKEETTRTNQSSTEEITRTNQSSTEETTRTNQSSTEETKTSRTIQRLLEEREQPFSRPKQRTVQETKPRYRAAHTKAIEYDENELLRPRPKLRNRLEKKGPGVLRSTRMPPNLEMQHLDDSAEKEQTMTSDSVPIDELSPFSIARQLKVFARKFTNVNITQEVVGRTAEFNDIVLLKVTEKTAFRSFRANEVDGDLNKFIDEVPAKKIIFIVHGLSVMGMRNIPCFNTEKGFTQLLTYYFNHLDKFDIFFIPMANPDGVALNLRFWNKNNSPQADCSGVALDRNFDVAWNGTKGMSSCCQHFPGPSPFSEAETRAIKDIFHRYSNKIAAYLHVHAATHSDNVYKGDAVLYPKGYTEVQSDDDKYIDMKGEIDEAMKNASFRFLSVAVETLHNWYGPIAGSSVDFASTVYGIPYAMEVVFQSYVGNDNILEVKQSEIVNNDMALIEIWRRMIDVIFNNIWRTTTQKEVR